MFRPSSDPSPLWESPVPPQDQKEHLGGEGMMKRYNLVDVGLLWAPDSSYQPAATLLTGCVQRGRVREELPWVLWRGPGQWHSITSLLDAARCSLRTTDQVWSLSVGRMWTPRGDGLVPPLGLHIFSCYSWPSSHVTMLNSPLPSLGQVTQPDWSHRLSRCFKLRHVSSLV